MAATLFKWKQVSYTNGMPPHLKYTEAALKAAVKQSKSIRQVIIVLKLNESGGTYLTLKRKFKEWDISTKHFLGQGHLKGGIPHNSFLLKDILSNKKYLKSSNLKKKLIKAEIFEYKCHNKKCGISDWKGKSITLELEHIDGDRYNNNLSNLKLLCPNCHSQTQTWRGRKNKRPGGGMADTPA